MPCACSQTSRLPWFVAFRDFGSPSATTSHDATPVIVKTRQIFKFATGWTNVTLAERSCQIPQGAEPSTHSATSARRILTGKPPGPEHAYRGKKPALAPTCRQ